MTTQTVHIQTYDYGASLTSATLRAIDTDTLVATADTTNEVTADSGLYAAVFGEVAAITAGTYRLRAVAGGQPINRYVTLVGVDAEVAQSRSERFAELPPNGITAAVLATDSITAAALAAGAVNEIQSGLATQTSVDAIQSDTDNIQTRLPAALEGGRMAAALDAASRLAIWNTLTTGTFTADSFGELLIISDGTNGREVKVTASGHMAADVHDVQPDGLSGSTEILAILADTNELQADWANGGRLDLILDARASQTSVDTIDDLLDTEVAALTAAVAIISDGVGFLTSVAMGAISDAGTAAETYVISFGGSTYTVDYTGLDATGNRTTTTRTKS